MVVSHVARPYRLDLAAGQADGQENDGDLHGNRRWLSGLDEANVYSTRLCSTSGLASRRREAVEGRRE